jgi:hypothetical protein
MRSHLYPFVLAAVLLAACKGDAPPKTASVGEAMPYLPLPPQGQIVGRAGSADALQLVFQSPAALTTVADFYRGVFTNAPWHLVSDTKDSAGTIALYAEQQSHPMWVRISASGSVTRVEVSGAVPAADTSFAARSRAARDSSNTMVPLHRPPR